jgi:hypothetical protein
LVLILLILCSEWKRAYCREIASRVPWCCAHVWAYLIFVMETCSFLWGRDWMFKYFLDDLLLERMESWLKITFTDERLEGCMRIAPVETGPDIEILLKQEHCQVSYWWLILLKIITEQYRMWNVYNNKLLSLLIIRQEFSRNYHYL